MLVQLLPFNSYNRLYCTISKYSIIIGLIYDILYTAEPDDSCP